MAQSVRAPHLANELFMGFVTGTDFCTYVNNPGFLSNGASYQENEIEVKVDDSDIYKDESVKLLGITIAPGRVNKLIKMPRAFLLKRISNEILSSSTTRCEEVLEGREQRKEDKIREKKREKLSRMIEEIKLAIKREDVTKMPIRREERNDRNDRNFSVARILKQNDTESNIKFDGKKSAFFVPSKRNYYEVYKGDYDEFFDFSTGPIIKKRKIISFPSKPAFSQYDTISGCTKSCCRHPKTIKNNNTYDIERSKNDHDGRWLNSPNTSFPGSESSSADSYDSGGNTVNQNIAPSVNKYKNSFQKHFDNRDDKMSLDAYSKRQYVHKLRYDDREYATRRDDREYTIRRDDREYTTRRDARDYKTHCQDRNYITPCDERDYIRRYENSFIHKHKNIENTPQDIRENTKLKNIENKRDQVSDKNHPDMYNTRHKATTQTKTVSRRRALLNEIENEMTLSKQTKLERENAAIKSAADILTIPPGTNRSRAMANLLERRRVAELNSAFETLREIVPLYGNEDRTLSKIKTLRYAMTYMRHLSALLKSESVDMSRFLIESAMRDSSVQKFRDQLVKRQLIL